MNTQELNEAYELRNILKDKFDKTEQGIAALDAMSVKYPPNESCRALMETWIHEAIDLYDTIKALNIHIFALRAKEYKKRQHVK